MKIRYIDFIQQTFDFPQDEFNVKNGQLFFNDISMMDLVEKYGTPLKFFYLPNISRNIQRAKKWFNKAIRDNNYNGEYHYCYCTKSSHFSFVLKKALANDINIETSYATDLEIVQKLTKSGDFNKERKIICNGFKTDQYLAKIGELHRDGFQVLPIIDSPLELSKLRDEIAGPIDIGIRIASEEEPKFEFYTSRLGIGYKDILPLYKSKIQKDERLNLKMLHFFINTGIRDNAYYWNEFFKCLKLYVELKKISPGLDSFNIGGGFPIKNSLAFNYDYSYMIDEIVFQIKKFCKDERVEEPDIYTEFGSYTVGESGGAVFKILNQKQQNDREKWNMIDSSFMTNLPDSWALSKRFILLPLNKWEDSYERVFLGGLTCDSDDYYNSEQHLNAIYLPQYRPSKPLYIGFFNTGAYQESLGGYGGLQHCLIPNPKILLIDKDKNGDLVYDLFAEQQSPESMLKLLGY
ncbi:MAG: arginine decarboxylase [Saprospirales bacterium]|nr:MAG: arginine decarboxylase [Saprospirales bacterium]